MEKDFLIYVQAVLNTKDIPNFSSLREFREIHQKNNPELVEMVLFSIAQKAIDMSIIPKEK